ncbi:MAG: hypothetical protein WA869_28130 [Alloacidobacterium sp.]
MNKPPLEIQARTTNDWFGRFENENKGHESRPDKTTNIQTEEVGANRLKRPSAALPISSSSQH